jgi:hypothetical protein
MSKPPAEENEPVLDERKGEMSDAFTLLHAAAELVRSHERDATFRPTPYDLAVLDRFIDELWFYQGSLRSVHRALKRRAGGE